MYNAYYNTYLSVYIEVLSLTGSAADLSVRPGFGRGKNVVALVDIFAGISRLPPPRFLYRNFIILT